MSYEVKIGFAGGEHDVIASTTVLTITKTPTVNLRWVIKKSGEKELQQLFIEDGKRIWEPIEEISIVESE